MIFLLSATVLLTLIALSGLQAQKRPSPRQDRSVASPKATCRTYGRLTRQSVRGVVVTLGEGVKHPLLFSFLTVLPDTEPSPSRTQIEFLRSMQQQYGHDGLRVVIAHETGVGSTAADETTALLIATYDLRLDHLPLISDANASLRSHFEVQTIPTTLLLDSRGCEVRKWTGLVLPAFLAEAIVPTIDASRPPRHPAGVNQP